MEQYAVHIFYSPSGLHGPLAKVFLAANLTENKRKKTTFISVLN